MHDLFIPNHWNVLTPYPECPLDKSNKRNGRMAMAVDVDPLTTPILYTDNVIVNSTDVGLTMDVVQYFRGDAEARVVSSIGMSFDAARKLLADIHSHLREQEHD